MEKIIRQSILRRNQIVKKARKEDLKEVRKQWRDHNQHKSAQLNHIQHHIRNERKARREDWMLGPLAPNRDAGAERGRYGAVENILARGAVVPSRYQPGPRGKGSDDRGSEDKNIFPQGEWSGKGIPGNVVIGDRVAVLRGRPGLKGMIGKITRIEPESQEVFLKDLNKVDVRVPPYTLSEKERIFAPELPIPMSDVRLVIPMHDPDTGTTQDHIVNELYGEGPWYPRVMGTSIPRHTRYMRVAGERYEIKWPEEDSEREYPQECDTPSKEVAREASTYIPSLSSSRSESSIIDELRDKYSRVRKTHDDLQWMQKKVLQDARSSWLKERQGLMAPLLKRQRDSASAARQPAVLSRTTENLIREVQSKSLRLNAL